MVVELNPGSYDFWWKNRTTDIVDKNAIPETLTKNLRGGEIRVFRSDFVSVTPTFAGLVATFTGPPAKLMFLEVDIETAKSEMIGANIVMPQNCDPKLCLQ